MSRHSSHAPRRVGAAYAAHVILLHYIPIYGHGLWHETPRSLRCKIAELEAQLEPVRHQRGAAYRSMVRNIVAYERIAELLEMLPV